MGMTPISPTKTGEMKQDVFWKIKCSETWAFVAEVEAEDRICQPVAAEACSFEDWRTAPKHAEQLREWRSFTHDRVLGRRINDEVELFEEDGMESLKESMEDKGLTVRMFKPEKGHKFPKWDYKAMNGDSGKNTLIKHCIKSLGNKIAEYELETGKSIDHGILAEADPKTKIIGIVMIDKKTFGDFEESKCETITLKDLFGIHEQKCKVLGYVRNSYPTFRCDEDVAKSFFDSLGNTKRVTFVDKVEEKERAEKEALKLEKKQAKKHRRQVTASTVTSPQSENSFTSLQLESDAAVKARQREKNRLKKKAQQERRKARDAEAEAATTTLAATTGDKDKGGDGNAFRFWAMSGTQIFLKNEKNQTIMKPQSELDSFEVVSDEEEAVDQTDLADEENSSGETSKEEEDDTRTLQVIHATDTTAFHQALERGCTVVVMGPSDDDE